MATKTVLTNAVVAKGSWTGTNADIFELIGTHNTGLNNAIGEGDTLTIGFEAAGLSDGDTITRIDIYTRAQAPDSNKDGLTVQLRIGGSLRGTAIPVGTLGATWTNSAALNDAAYNTDWTSAQLDAMEVDLVTTQTGMAGNVNIDLDAVNCIITYTPAAGLALDYDSYGIFDDGTDAAQTFHRSGSVVENQPATIYTDDGGADFDFVVRVRGQETGGSGGAATDDHKLQYRRKPITTQIWGSWTDVTNGADTYMRTNTASAMTDTNATTQRLSAGTGGFQAGEQEDGNGEVTNYTIVASKFLEHAFAVTAQSAGVVDGDLYEFRVLLNGAVTNLTYSAVPTLLVLNDFVLEQIEAEAFTLSAATTSSNTLTTTLGAIERAFHWHGWEADSASVAQSHTSARLTSTSNLDFVRGGASDLNRQFYHLVEGTTGIVVERGVESGTLTTVETTTLTEITDITRAFVIVDHENGNTSGGNDEGIMAWLSIVDGKPTLNIQTDVTNASNNVGWQVVQMSNARVQRGTKGSAWTTATFTAAVSAAASAGTMLVQFNGRYESDPSGTNLDWTRASAILTSSILITFTKSANTQQWGDVAWEAIEFVDGTSVQEIEATTSDFPTSTTQADLGISAVTVANSVAVSSGFESLGEGTWATNDETGESRYTLELTSTTNLRATRGSANAAAEAVFYVIDFTTGGATKTFALVSLSESEAAIAKAVGRPLIAASTSESAATAALVANRPLAAVSLSESAMTAVLGRQKAFLLASLSESSCVAGIVRTVPWVANSSSESSAAASLTRTLNLIATSDSPSTIAAAITLTEVFAAVSISNSEMLAALVANRPLAAVSTSESAGSATLVKVKSYLLSSTSTSALLAGITRTAPLAAVSTSPSAGAAATVVTKVLALTSSSTSGAAVVLDITRAFALSSLSESAVAVALTVTTSGVTREFVLVSTSESESVVALAIARNIIALATSESSAAAALAATRPLAAQSESDSAAAAALVAGRPLSAVSESDSIVAVALDGGRAYDLASLSESSMLVAPSFLTGYVVVSESESGAAVDINATRPFTSASTSPSSSFSTFVKSLTFSAASLSPSSIFADITKGEPREFAMLASSSSTLFAAIEGFWWNEASTSAGWTPEAGTSDPWTPENPASTNWTPEDPL